MSERRADGALAGPRFHAVFEDDAIVVVHKGPGLLSVPDDSGKPALSGLLDAALKGRDGMAARAYPVHRLDRDVSGLLVFAKTSQARDALRAQFAAGEPARTYVAIVAGKLKAGEGTFRGRIDTQRREGGRAVGRRGPGAPATTHWQVLRFGGPVTMVSVELETGRKNQIRAHFAAAGHPLLGDRRYDGPERDGFDRRRIALHAMRLTFAHPTTGRTLTFDDPPPPTFDRPFASQRQ